MLGSFFATLALMPLLIWLAPRWGLVCRPGGRRNHTTSTPLVGGIALVLGFLPAAAFLPVTRPLVALGLASALLLGVGVIDDRSDLRWRYRLAAQALAGAILFYIGGVRIESIGSALGFVDHSLGSLSAPFTIIATVGLINAMNMIDGVDGLAGSVSLAALTMLVAAAVYAGNTLLAQVSVLAAGGVTAVLVFNLRLPWNPRGRVFLGCGSEILGLVIAWGCFRLTQNPSHPVTPVLAPFLIAPPVIDCLVLIVRRIRSGGSPFLADSSHFHHLLLRAGLSANQVVAAITGTTFAFGLTAALVRRAHLPEPLFVVGFLALCVAYYIWSVRWERRHAPLADRPGSAQSGTKGQPHLPPSAAHAKGAHGPIVDGFHSDTLVAEFDGSD